MRLRKNSPRVSIGQRYSYHELKEWMNENGLGKLTENIDFNVKRDMVLFAEPVLMRLFNHLAKIV